MDEKSKCFWCGKVFDHDLAEYDENAEPHCPYCKRAGLMKA